MDVFTYGSLQFPEVLRAVIGRLPRSQPARLEGFARYRVRGATHPAIIAEAGAATEGTLWRDLDRGALAALDRFEGAFYERRLLPVVTQGGATLQAYVYVVADARRGALGPEPWDKDRFEREDLAAFVKAYRPEG